ncbi:hypothetical protein LZ198_36150 [Myxococcus sp. K15C18031901]|uniref:hypothetical protein n=1 Tax=Myxococcus dinghuensis TaxID=2906761 RepID=UPI0020A6EE3A|nr:hypothetical protein [Myxococcus dinghuensis]MCP3104311.1 hypothetical protein [Myxococcus dinghuensis]
MDFTVRRPPRLFVALVPLVLAGCGSGSVPKGAAPGEVGESTSEIRIANSLSTDALVLNAISTNGPATTLLANSSLSSLFDPNPMAGNAHIRKQLNDPDAQKFMEYLVSCALDSSQVLGYYNPLGVPGPASWKGKAGLCTDWLTQAPTMECLNRVSGCLLARNNALGRRVELSIRGEVPNDSSIFYLEAVTRPAEHDPNTAQHKSSFSGCGAGEVGESRDCGWIADGIGVCTPGDQIWIGAGGSVSCPSGPMLGSTWGAQMALRVCEGVVGCDSGDTTRLAEAATSCDSLGPVASFTCPAGGYYSVMTAPYDSATFGVATIDVYSKMWSRYALSEQEVFAIREGAFYGNIFDAKYLATQVDVIDIAPPGEKPKYVVEGDHVVIPGAIYKNMYSCFDPAWSSPAAYAAHRVCALPNSGANCASTVVGACWGTSASNKGKCQLDDGPLVPGDGDFELCKDNKGKVWKEPVTTFLHDACGPVEAGKERACVRSSKR